MHGVTPVFLFAAGWRSGSTLLQRMITASREVLVWGEAGGALECFTDAWARYEQMLGPGGDKYKHGFGGNGSEEYKAFVQAGGEGSKKWIACMNPPAHHIREALCEGLDRIYGQPSRALGYERWGVKEVRSGLDTARFLNLLFPEAKFVFLVRHPINCLESIKRRAWIDLERNDDPLARFAGHWANLAGQFRDADFGMALKFEDLTSNSDKADQLAKYLQIENLPIRFPHHSRADWNPVSDHGLSRWEKRRLLKIVGEEMQKWDYEPQRCGP